MAFWSKKKPITHTNAPRHWPTIELDLVDNPGINLLLIGAELAALAKPETSSIAFLRDFLYEDGILRVPILVEEGGQKTAVFVYAKGDPNAAAHYSGVRALLRSRENASTVYYGPDAIMPAKPDVVLQSIDTPLFSKSSEAENGDFALWWASEEAPLLANSEERVLLDRWFEALDGYGFLILTAFLKDLELVEGKDGMYALPAQPLLQPLLAPGGTRVLLHASAQEGLFIAFDETTAVARRRLLLRLLADFAAQYRRAIDAKGLAPNPAEKGLGLDCWRAIRDAALGKEASGGTGLKLHAVTLRDGQPLRSPNATTTEDRAAQPQAPGSHDLDFGMDLLDRVLERLKRKPVTGSTQEALGMPNFAPVIAAKVGAEVFERQLPFEDVPVAQAAAGRVLDEWPDAEIVAVISDGAIREGGERVDIFDLRIEHTAGRAGALFQRYRVSGGGGIDRIGRPTAMPSERFLLQASATRLPAPGEALTALAQQAVATIVASLTVVEPSGMCSDDPEEALLSPSALLGIAGDPRPHTVRFMMQGPITAAMSCLAHLQGKPEAEWVVFHLDDLVSRNGNAERSLRLCVQRRRDAGIAIFDQRYETPRKGKPFACRGGLEFKRWGGSMFPPAG